MRVNNSKYCALLVACTLVMGNRAAGDAWRSVQATLILFIRTKHESMQVNLKPRLDSLKSTKHECSYADIINLSNLHT